LETDECVCGFEVLIREIKRRKGGGFALERFKLAALPRCLTDILTAAPIKSKRELVP
jgi:hypothetical protein